MAQIYFHCSNAHRLIVDWCGSKVEDLNEACDVAERVVRALINSPNLEDWRTWTLHVSDGNGEIFRVPFSSAISRLH